MIIGNSRAPLMVGPYDRDAHHSRPTRRFVPNDKRETGARPGFFSRQATVNWALPGGAYSKIRALANV